VTVEHRAVGGALSQHWERSNRATAAVELLQHDFLALARASGVATRRRDHDGLARLLGDTRRALGPAIVKASIPTI
jgi:hypothetical protein